MQSAIAVAVLNAASVMHQSALNINNINTLDNIYGTVIMKKSL